MNKVPKVKIIRPPKKQKRLVNRPITRATEDNQELANPEMANIEQNDVEEADQKDVVDLEKTDGGKEMEVIADSDELDELN